MFVTFSGLDGAGKSTLIDWLHNTLEGRSRPATVFHMNDHIGLYAYLRAIRDRVAGGPPSAEWRPGDAAAGPRTGRQQLEDAYRSLRYRILWNKTLRRLIYPFDLLVFSCYRFYHEVVRGHVLIMDRYFYDTLVDVYDARGTAWLRVLEWITPVPTLAVFLDVTPEESFRRKGEYTIDYLRRRGAAYKHVFTWVPAALTLSQCDLPTSLAALDRAVSERLNGRR